MCLTLIIEIESTKNGNEFPKEIAGYKVFRSFHGTGLTSQFSHSGYARYQRGRWHYDTKPGYITGPGISYRHGYHMYTNKKDAMRAVNSCWREAVVAKVRLQRIHTRGKQYITNIGTVYVGEKMIIGEIIHTVNKGYV